MKTKIPPEVKVAKSNRTQIWALAAAALVISQSGGAGLVSSALADDQCGGTQVQASTTTSSAQTVAVEKLSNHVSNLDR